MFPQIKVVSDTHWVVEAKSQNELETYFLTFFLIKKDKYKKMLPQIKVVSGKENESAEVRDRSTKFQQITK